MSKWSAVCFFLLLTAFTDGQGLPPIGQWREHLPWNNAINVANNSGVIVCATPYALFTYDTDDGTFVRKSRISGLSDIGVRSMAFDPASGKTLIAYLNGNIDVLFKDRLINIPDIKLSTVPGDKTINRIFIQENKAYLSTNLGIIVLDLVRYEVEDTWRIGANGTEIKTYALALNGDVFYAATDEGLKMASASSNMADYRNWSISVTNGLPAGPCSQVLTSSGRIIVMKNDTLYSGASGNFQYLYAAGSEISQADTTLNGILVSERMAGRGRVVQLNGVGNIVGIFQPAGLSRPRQALIQDKDCWIADQDNGLFRVTGTSAEKIFPNSPINISSGEMKFSGTTLWAMAGKVTDAWNYTFNPNGIYRFSGESWDGYNLYVYPKLDSLLDFITVTDQPSTGSVFAGSFGGGLLEITRDNRLVVYKQNSALQPAIGDPGSYRVGGLATDQMSNIWISNYGAPQDILVRKTDGQWKSFTIPFFHLENAVSAITIDDYDQKWIVSPKGNGLFLFNSGSSIDNTGDDSWKYFRKGKGNGNLPSSNVFCAVKDKNGFIWVGTDNGIGIITCVQDAVNIGCEAVIPIVQQDNFAGYLFQDEEVRSIAVDGANRKWVGTKNGLWLISPEGDKIIYQFNMTNSPILDNDVSALAINPESGELFIATASGICSYRSTATEGTTDHTNVLVYPNPVPPGYHGTIAIRGLAANSQVKITEMDGRLVYQVKALGGQAIWNGKDYKGNSVSSGVYIVLATDEQNREKVAAKIFFIR